jgi:AMP phosphorylase
MRLKLKKIHFDAGRPVVFLNTENAQKLDVHPGDRIELSANGKHTISIADIAEDFINSNEIAVSKEINDFFSLKKGEFVKVKNLPQPESLRLISKKMAGKELSKKEIYSIIKDIAENAITEAEVSYFVLGVYERGMSYKETLYLTEAMCNTGLVLKWPKKWKVADKHSIGGIPGNRTTPIVISICAASGVIMPKTSSRAITSAAGTADVIESLAKVDIEVKDLERIVKKTGACFVWGGSLGLAPADDKLIRVERILNLDPESQLLASILSKKLSAGSKYILIDIPFGEGAKVSRKQAENLRIKFLRMAKHFRLHMKVIMTDGSQPIGNGVGPTLEMMDVLRVLKREDPPIDLEDKSLLLAGEILELTGKAKKGLGIMMAANVLNSKKALSKFEEIIAAQGKKKGFFKLGKIRKEIFSKKSGKINSIDNKIINHIGRILGCPADKGAGIYIHKKNFETVKKGEIILTFYSESKSKLIDAIKLYDKEGPFKIM